MKKSIILVVVVLLVTLGGYFVTQNDKPDKPQNLSSFTKQEVTAHNTKQDCWTIINGGVYNITPYIQRHPGGNEITRACGNDGTVLFAERKTQDGQPVGSGTPHSVSAKSQLEEFKIGTVKN